MSKVAKKLTKEEALKLLSYLNNAYKDYKAARILLLNEQLLQGCVMANTCIEKYLKTFLLFHEKSIKNNHEIVDFFDQLRSLENGKINKVNREFLLVLCKAYKTRYFHNDNVNYIPIGFNLVILKNEFLAELDFTISIFAKKIEIGQKKSLYFSDIEKKEVFIIQENYLLNGLSKEDFTSKKPESIYELRKMPNGEIMEINYATNDSKGNKQFDLQGLQIIDDGKFNSIKLNYIPI